jgi:hypothetical protein
MKRRITLSIALSLCIGLFALMSSDSAKAETLYRADTGMITLAPNEFLRITVASTSRVRSLTVTFTARITQSTCSGGVCTHTVISNTTTNPVTLMPGQAASHDIIQPSGASAVRGIVIGNNPDAVVNAMIIDGITGGTRTVGGVIYAALHGNDV